MSAARRAPPLRGPRSSVLATAALVRDPYAFHRGCRERYGEPYLVPSLNGPVVCTGDPEGVREIFSAAPATFAPWAVGALEPVLGAGSVILMSGERHRRERQVLAPPFQGPRMRAYGEVMQEAARAHVRAWRGGQIFRALDTMQEISLEVILRAVFGVEDAPAIERSRAAVRRFVACASPWLLFTKSLQRRFFGIGPWARLQRAQAEWDALILEQIRERGRRGAQSDVLGSLLAARDEDGQPLDAAHVRDTLVTMLFAGHETTALALSWALYWLHRDPRELGLLRAELDALPRLDPEAVERLPRLEAVCNEALRLHPIVPDVLRLVVAPFDLRGRAIEPGTGVAAVTALVHADPTLYPEPGAFRPGRFLERTFKPWEFFPFGGGARRCIGASFALHEMKQVLAVLVREHELELCEPGPVRPRRRNVTMGPSTGVRMRWLRQR